MTVGGFREVDHDLLADYLGGALDGTPEEAVVARLVADDAAWAEAYALLAPAVDGVRADLARWGEPVAELPESVAARITAALAALPPSTVDPLDTPAEPTAHDIADRPTTDEAGTDGDAVDEAGREDLPASPGPRLVPSQAGSGRRRPAAGVPRTEPGRAATGPGRRRRRFGRIAGPVALAAVSLAAVGLGVNQLVAGGRPSGGSAGTAMDHPASAPEAASGAGPVRTTGPARRSGTNYTPETLAAADGATKARTLASNAPGEQPHVDAEGGRLPAPDGSDRLARLTDQAALTTCLDEIAAEQGAGPLVADLVDYAAFDGEQALVVRFTDRTGARWAWVTGPECGVPGSGADTRYRTRVG